MYLFNVYPQVECNTKLDPTKTTLLKVKEPVSLPLSCFPSPSTFCPVSSFRL